MSNAERQRQFRLRNPGYYGRLHRQRKAGRLAAMQRAAAVCQPVAVAARVPLMLPAPEQASNYEGMALLRQIEAEVGRRREAVPVER